MVVYFLKNPDLSEADKSITGFTMSQIFLKTPMNGGDCCPCFESTAPEHGFSPSGGLATTSSLLSLPPSLFFSLIRGGPWSLKGLGGAPVATISISSPHISSSHLSFPSWFSLVSMLIRTRYSPVWRCANSYLLAGRLQFRVDEPFYYFSILQKNPI